MKKTAAVGNILVFLAAFFWSTAGLFTRIVPTDFPTTLFWRSVFGGVAVCVIFMIFARIKNPLKLFRFQRCEVAIASLICIGMICFIAAFFYTSVANVSFVYGLMPLVTFFLSWLFLRETGTVVIFGLCLLSMVGVACVMWEIKRLDDWVGLSLAFGMVLFMSALTIATKYYPQADVSKSTYLSAFMCAVIVVPFASFEAISPVNYGWLFLYGLTNVGFGFGVYLLGVARTTAISASIITLVEIPIGPIWTWVFYAEPVAFFTLVGGTIIMCSTLSYLLYVHKTGSGR